MYLPRESEVGTFQKSEYTEFLKSILFYFLFFGLATRYGGS